MGATVSSFWASLPCGADFYPLTPEAWHVALNGFQYFPLVTTLQWLISWHPAGKTSLRSSIFNIPGRIAWCAMEIIGPVNLLYNLTRPSPTLPALADLPTINKLVAALYCIHYFNRAIISPFFAAPSMSPIHVLVMTMAMAFNWFNSSCIAGWLRGYALPVPGYTTDGTGAGLATSYPVVTDLLPVVGVAVFAIGMVGNIYSERKLFQLRRESAAKQSAKKTDDADNDSSKTEAKCAKVYVIPPRQGVFRYILYPHYAFEWLEWVGFALVGTAVFPLSPTSASLATRSELVAPPLTLAPWLVPAVWLADWLAVPLPLPGVLFVVNAVANMLPHARWGRKWYVEKFGKEAVGRRGAAVPGCVWM